MREHQITPTTPIYVGLGGYDTSTMYLSVRNSNVYLWRPALPTDRPSTDVVPVRILPGDILNIDGIGRYEVQPTRGPLEPRLTPAA